MYSKRLLVSCALAAVVAASPSGSSAGAAADVTSSILPNGITVVTRERPGSLVFAIDTAVRAGARYETAGTASAARVLESALLLGTERYPTRDDLVRTIAGRGGDLSVSAGREIVEVGVTVGLPDADLAIDVLAEVLLRSAFDPEAIEREREVILQQVQEREDEPEDVASDRLYTTVFAGHPLSNLPYGTSEGVASLSVDAVRGYWAGRLVGPLVLVSVVSGMPHEQVVAKLSAALADVPAGPVPAANYRDLPPPTAQIIRLPLGTDQSHVFIGAPVPGVAHEDRAPLRVLNAVLGRTSGRLFSEVRDKRGLAYSAYSSVVQFVDGGAFVVYAGTQPQSADAVLTVLRDELTRIREHAIGADELQNAIGGELGARILGIETSANEALYIARDIMFGIPTEEIQAAQLRAVSTADVQRVAQRYLDPARLSVIVTGPASADEATP